jgi:hypothetical protein
MWRYYYNYANNSFVAGVIVIQRAQFRVGLSRGNLEHRRYGNASRLLGCTFWILAEV